MKDQASQVESSVVAKLQAEAKANPVFNALCHAFALRKRTRGRLTVTRLKQAMDAEGFTFNRKDYEKVLKFLGDLGLGTLSISPRGKIKALNNMKYRVQNIGEIGLSQKKTLQKRHEVKKYENIMDLQNDMHKQDFIEEVKTVAKQKAVNKKQPIRAEESYPTFLTMLMGGKIINIPGPANITPENLGEFIVQFKNLAKNGKASKGDLEV